MVFKRGIDKARVPVCGTVRTGLYGNASFGSWNRCCLREGGGFKRQVMGSESVSAAGLKWCITCRSYEREYRLKGAAIGVFRFKLKRWSCHSGFVVATCQVSVARYSRRTRESGCGTAYHTMDKTLFPRKHGDPQLFYSGESWRVGRKQADF